MMSSQEKPNALFKSIDFLLSAQQVPDAPQDVKDSFLNLAHDPYPAQGRRSRRLSRCTATENGNLFWCHDASFYQHRENNNMSGGVKREWEPLEENVAKSKWLCQLVFRVKETLGLPIGTTFEIHQFRVFCSTETMGHPAPEGPHQDGRQFVAIAHVNQKNAKGGLTQLYSALGEPAFLQIKLQPRDLLVFNDRQYFHFTTPVQPISPHLEGFRDVFILTVPFFT